ncbi:LPS assembly lipoprotein LptE [Chlamydia sp.]|uniref:LPS assembly lipoprotein LptE n=1 Tax=Chlamydia sp. TaxID=35827 RepID=UPI0025BE3102|nr:LPS assembly lipoprotein LptE [Chlamydia sp.]MBQ8498957.1 lipopolysaccharide-assembly family protein [Chlamydia sp.]
MLRVSWLTSLIFCTFVLSSCGYTLLSPCNTKKIAISEGIYVCPIAEDSLGDIVSALSYELEKRSLPTRSQESAAGYLLKVFLFNETDENIGFTYTPKKPREKTAKHFIVSNEGRLALSAKVQLINKRSQEVIVEKCLKETVTFDFQPDLGIANAHQFALGQFEMHNEAKKSASRILCSQLAANIVQQVYYDLF